MSLLREEGSWEELTPLNSQYLYGSKMEEGNGMLWKVFRNQTLTIIGQLTKKSVQLYTLSDKGSSHVKITLLLKELRSIDLGTIIITTGSQSQLRGCEKEKNTHHRKHIFYYDREYSLSMRTTPTPTEPTRLQMHSWLNLERFPVSIKTYPPNPGNNYYISRYSI